MNNSSLPTTLHLPAALVLCSPADAGSVATRSKFQVVLRTIGSLMGGVVAMLRYQPSVSERTISETGVGELLRRR